MSENIIDNYIHIVDDLYDINEFFDCQNRIQDTDFFQKLIIIMKEKLKI